MILNILFFPFNISTLTGTAVYSAFTKVNSGDFFLRNFANLMCEHTQKVIVRTVAGKYFPKVTKDLALFRNATDRYQS